MLFISETSASAIAKFIYAGFKTLVENEEELSVSTELKKEEDPHCVLHAYTDFTEITFSAPKAKIAIASRFDVIIGDFGFYYRFASTDAVNEFIDAWNEVASPDLKIIK